ncbi:hypothetical protein [Dyella caseinilytica]|uniref:Uncharacterized protein n=1 Tax=Dyella caseinilytica TaxID=1849581 RepID=A0ABX7GYG3_9GAMM|nr:hypothetical protein [Dyella caseinilytica]QRN55491.1 hypothetical protein ISN74_09300 [Dyella caseinilytica]GGA02150.1 hypothetical protein GCM10011408_24440 [Dyella caseinilytica]
MTQSDPDVSAALRSVAVAWLKRPLTPQEEQELDAFQAGSGAASGGASDQASGDPAAYARAQAEQAVKEGQARTDTAIRDVLQKIQSTTTQALQANDRETQAILKVVEAAKTLADLRPSALNTSGASAPTNSRIAMSQIADRLANLVKTEVEQSFKQNFGRLQQQLEQAIGEINAVREQVQQTSSVTNKPQTPNPPQAATPSASAPQGGISSG